ncbi:MAG: hypothetical protein KAS04_05360 [Candidatus Aenigmarchaeota archaeon]|nr:hypothetical protein [Candidatus Aenigmarchaeota archaeon]
MVFTEALMIGGLLLNPGATNDEAQLIQKQIGTDMAIFNTGKIKYIEDGCGGEFKFGNSSLIVHNKINGKSGTGFFLNTYVGNVGIHTDIVDFDGNGTIDFVTIERSKRKPYSKRKLAQIIDIHGPNTVIIDHENPPYTHKLVTDKNGIGPYQDFVDTCNKVKRDYFGNLQKTKMKNYQLNQMR